MKNGVKTFFTVIIAAICLFVVLIGIAVFETGKYDTGYKVSRSIDMEIKHIEAEPLGNTYSGITLDDSVFYKVNITVYNASNMTKNSDDIFFSYSSDESDVYYKVNEFSDNTFFINDNRQVIPAGKETVLTKIVEVENGCNLIKVTYSNFINDTRENYQIKL